MTTPKHTPGPWTVAYHDKNGQAVVSGEHSEVCTCWHHSVVSLEERMQANAYLIAAAPDLLAACADWISWLKPDAPWREDAADHEARMLDAMRAAIARAEGK